jgi:hypothetical protein
MLFSCYLHFIYVFVVYPTKLSVTQTIQRRNKEWYVNYELERMWKKRSWPNLRHYHCICHKGLKKTTENFRITGLRAEIWNRNLQKTRYTVFINLLTASYCLTCKKQKKKSSPATRHEGAWGRGGIAPIQSWPRNYMGVSGQRHAAATLCPGERTPGTHCTGGWVGVRVSLDTKVRRKILCPCRGSNPDRPIFQFVARHCTDWATQALSHLQQS